MYARVVGGENGICRSFEYRGYFALGSTLPEGVSRGAQRKAGPITC
jgi:hypothetical protein